MQVSRNEWVECPVCKEPDMQKQISAQDTMIYCTNQACLSNGGKFIHPDVLEALVRERDYQRRLDSPS